MRGTKPTQGPKARNVIARPIGPGCQTANVRGPTVRYVKARAAGPGERSPGIIQGLKGHPSTCPAPVPPLQGGGKFVWTSSRPFRSGYHRPGLQPDAAAYAKHPALLRQLELEVLAALAQNANARIYIGFDKHVAIDLAKNDN